MDVLIRLDRDQPPAGTVMPLPDPGSPPDGVEAGLRFAGWLGLLHALAALLDTGESGGR